jgi:signal transduction histidine kinase
VLLAVAGLSVVAGLAGAVLLPASRAGDLGTRATVAAFLLGMALLAVVGFLLVRRRVQRRIGLLLLAVGALGAAGRAVIGVALADPGRTPDVLAWATNWAWVPGAGAVLLLLLRFPTGELPSARWRWAERAVLAWTAGTLLVTAVVPGDLAVSPLARPNPVGIDSAPWLAALLGPAFLVLPALTVLAAAAPVVRYRAADGVQRQQLRWVAAAVLVLALAAPLAAAGSAGGAVVEGLAYLLVPVAVVVAVLRYRLWDLGLVVRRGLVYAVASAALLAVHVGTVTLSAPLLSGRVPEALATAVVAVSAVPFLAGAQRAVERLLFGERRDPDRAVRSLAQRLAATPEALLPQVVEEVARSLRLPYVAVELADGTVGAAAGAPVADRVRVPLRHRGTTVGWLVAAPRSPGETLDGRDLHLLRQVADHAGLAVHSTLLAAELRTAADRLRTARAEERERLRADLHDELGPALGAISMRAEAARNLLAGGELRRADDVLGTIERGTEAAVAEVRRILADLQPRVLEEDGLEAALRAVAAAVPEGMGVRLDLDLPPVLPPRIELAAYRVAAEGVRNAVRHAGAGSVTIALRSRGGGVELEVRDDGIGLPADHRPGVGLRSMHARAAELGGSLHVAAEPTGGTTLRLVLPVGAP